MDIRSFPPELYALFIYTPFDLHAIRCTCRWFSKLADPFSYNNRNVAKLIKGHYIDLRVYTRGPFTGVARLDGQHIAESFYIWPGEPVRYNAILVRDGRLEYLDGSVKLYQRYKRLVHYHPRVVCTKVTPAFIWPQEYCDQFGRALRMHDGDIEVLRYAGVEVRVRIRSIVVIEKNKKTTVYSRTSSKNPVIIPAGDWGTIYSGCPKALPLIAGLTEIYAQFPDTHELKN